MQVKDSSSPAQTASQGFSIVIAAAGAPVSITTSSLPSGTQNVGYSTTLAATGGKTPYTWSITSGSLPTGVTLTASSGLIAGTPTQSGTFPITVQVKDSSSPAQTASQGFSIVIAAAGAPVSITTSSLPSGTQNVGYSTTLAATGGKTPYTWSITSGSLPTGVTLTASSGLIAGTPTQSGTFPITVQVKDSSSPAQTASQGFSIVIAAAGAPVSITTSSLPSGTQNVGYSTTLAATGGKTPYTWSITSGSLPTGVTLTASSGLISGTPTQSGTFPITVQVKDSSSPAQTASQGFSIVIASGPIVISGQDGTVIEGLKITSTTGDCLQIINSTNITVQNSEIGPCAGNAVKISEGDGINIFDSYIHPETLSPGCCDHNDGIFAVGTSNLLIQGNVIAYGESNINVFAGSTVTVTGNLLLNPRGPESARGNNFHCWSQTPTGTGCSNVTVNNNYALCSTDTTTYLYPDGCEDDIGFGYTTGIIAQGNFITGGQSAAGCGLIADKRANSAQFLNNKLLDTGQCGIGIADGTNQLVDSNKVLNRNPVPGSGNQGIYVWQSYLANGNCSNVTVSNNISVEYKPNGNQSGFWNGPAPYNCAPLTLTNNIFGQAADSYLTPVDQVFPPPLIPPQPKNCVVNSPYSTQTAWSPCAP